MTASTFKASTAGFDGLHSSRSIKSGVRRALGLCRSRHGGRLAKVLRHVCDWFPLTPLGLMAVVALTLLLITVGGPHQDRIVLALGTCGLAVITLLVLLVYARRCRSSSQRR